MAHAPEPPFTHDRTPRIGILLANLGTPDAPTPSAVRRYLAQFLSDPRVVEIPPWLWKPILHGVILRVRPAESARKYADDLGQATARRCSCTAMKQKTLLLGYLGQRLKEPGLRADLARSSSGCATAIRAIGAALDRLRAAHCERILVRAAFSRNTRRARRRRRSTPCPPICATVRRLPGLRFVDSVPRRPRLHPGAGAKRQRLLGAARPPRRGS